MGNASYQHLSLTALRESATPELVLAAYYEGCSDEQINTAYAAVARGVAVFEEMPRGELGPALRRHFNVLVAEQQKRKEVASA